MLVLKRGLNQKVVIERGRITVTVLEIRGGTVRLGFEAPREVPVHREEIFNQLEADNQRPFTRNYQPQRE